MRRFFISNLERLLNVLTVLAGLALLAWAIMLGQQAQGDLVQLLMAAAILLGGLVAIVALAGCAALALAIHDQTRRIAALLDRPAAVTSLRASRNPSAPRPAQSRETAPLQPEPAAYPASGAAPLTAPAPLAAPAPLEPATAPEPALANRPAFSSLTMPKAAIAPKQTEPSLRAPATTNPMAAAPSQNPLAQRVPRLVADKRLLR